MITLDHSFGKKKRERSKDNRCFGANENIIEMTS